MTADPPGRDPDLEDRELLARHIAGDPAAFGVLAQRHYERLWAVALRITRNPEDAADAVQEGLISAMRAAPGFRGDARVTTWLHRIVVNAALDRYRRRNRGREVPLPDHDALRHPVDPVDRLAAREAAVEIERALAALPVEQRAAIILVDVEGWPVADAASILGVAPGTVKSRCHRGRARLASDLAHLRNRDGDVHVPYAKRGGRGGGA